METRRKVCKYVLTAAATAALSLGLASSALAVPPTFTVNPLSIPGTVAPTAQFDATFIQGTSSELLTIQADNLHVFGDGWLQFTGFSAPGGGNVNSGVTGLSQYNLYLTFHLEDVLVSGTIGAPNSSYNLTVLDFQLFADPGATDTFTNATSAPTPATVTDNGVPDILLGSGTLINGTAQITPAGGAALNSTQTLTLTPAGDAYFIQPVPFFTIAFTEFNNTGPGVSFNLPFIAIQSASGGVDFAPVPEPGTLALFGISLLGLVGIGRRRYF